MADVTADILRIVGLYEGAKSENATLRAKVLTLTKERDELKAENTEAWEYRDAAHLAVRDADSLVKATKSAMEQAKTVLESTIARADKAEAQVAALTKEREELKARLSEDDSFEAALREEQARSIRIAREAVEFKAQAESAQRQVVNLKKAVSDFRAIMRAHGHKPDESDYYAALYGVADAALSPEQEQKPTNLRPPQSETQSADDSAPVTSGQTVKSNAGVSHGLPGPCEFTGAQATAGKECPECGAWEGECHVMSCQHQRDEKLSPSRQEKGQGEGA